MHNQQSGQFTKKIQITPVNLQGKYVGARGPLYIPPSEQGQPIIFHAGGSPNAHEFTGRFANAVIGAAFTLEDARAQRNAFRETAISHCRDHDEIKYIPGLMTTIAKYRRAALDCRIQLGSESFAQRAGYLQQMLGIPLDVRRLEQPLSKEQLEDPRPSSYDPCLSNALKIAKEGWSLRIYWHTL